MASAKDMAFIGCRLFALYVLYQAIHRIGFSALYLDKAIKTDLGLNLAEPTILALIIDIALFILLWFAAGRIAAGVSGGQEDSSGEASLSRKELLATAVAICGVFVLVIAVPRAAGVLATFLFTGRAETFHLFHIIPLLGMGLICIFGASYFAGLVIKARRWGLD
ncbi:hypothetical protein RJ527_03420 [Thalassospiraceae bacterium LMO-SO8]|nr:hypothetical protein [Alphaproteobacteria bacterium LMO-S08]WND76800.1 hypothetical protein RJ527_03420 [Thalassospiraceae bacterium LMO-SO8]